MKFTAELPDARRPYRQTARAQAAEATGERILDAFVARLRDGWFDEIRLEDVAQGAGVSVQTVIRRFGGKDGLLDAAFQWIGREIDVRRDVAPGDTAGAVRALSDDYEVTGDLVIRSLAQEDRYRGMRRITDAGRAFHRAWVARVFAPWLQGEPDAARRRLDALVVATDLYLWKLLRRDMNRPAAEYQAHVATLIAAALAEPPPATPDDPHDQG